MCLAHLLINVQWASFRWLGASAADLKNKQKNKKKWQTVTPRCVRVNCFVTHRALHVRPHIAIPLGINIVFAFINLKKKSFTQHFQMKCSVHYFSQFSQFTVLPFFVCFPPRSFIIINLHNLRVMQKQLISKAFRPPLVSSTRVLWIANGKGFT